MNFYMARFTKRYYGESIFITIMMVVMDRLFFTHNAQTFLSWLHSSVGNCIRNSVSCVNFVLHFSSVFFFSNSNALFFSEFSLPFTSIYKSFWRPAVSRSTNGMATFARNIKTIFFPFIQIEFPGWLNNLTGGAFLFYDRNSHDVNLLNRFALRLEASGCL